MMTQKKYKPWFHLPKPARARSDIRLFCFHYAGGRAEIFNTWPNGLSEGVEVCAVQLPGRSYRLNEPPICRSAELIDELKTAMQPLLDVPFAFFGHSMGALLAFELTRALDRGNDGNLPLVLFVSGRRAPQTSSYYPAISELPDLELLEVLRTLNGTPLEALQEDRLMKHFLPAIRADFALEEKWVYVDDTPLTIPIWALCGTQDNGASYRTMQAWRAQTTGAFRQFSFEGEHFFIHQYQDRILELVAQALSETHVTMKMDAECT